MSGPFLFDPRAFWGDENVKMMTGEQVAAYVRLLSHQWEEGSIPADPARIAVILTDGARRYTSEEVAGDLLPALNGCFEPTPENSERLANNRLARERESWLRDKKKASRAGRAGGIASGKSRRSKGKPSNDRSTIVERSLNDSRTESNDLRTISSSSSLSLSTSLPTSSAEVDEGGARGPEIAAAAAAELKSEEARFFDSLEAHFNRERGVARLLDSQDYQAARNWYKQGIPLDLIQREISGVFAKHRERGNGDLIQTLRYCRKAVEMAWSDLRELTATGDREVQPEPAPIAAYRLARGADAERWSKTRDSLRGELDAEVFATWIRPLSPVEVDGEHVLALAAPNEGFAHAVAESYHDRLEVAAGGAVLLVVGRAEAAA